MTANTQAAMRYGSCQSPYPKMAGSSVGKYILTTLSDDLLYLSNKEISHLKDVTFKLCWN